MSIKSNMGKGYQFEREIELWFCGLAGQDPSVSPEARTYRTPSSGAIRGIKGDVRTKIDFLPSQLLVECKARKSGTKKDHSIVRLEKEWLTKTTEEAHAEGKIPVVMISFKGTKRGRIWAILLKQDCQTLCIPEHEDRLEFEGVSDTMKLVRNVICKYDQVQLFWSGRIYVMMPLEIFGDYLRRWKHA